MKEPAHPENGPIFQVFARSLQSAVGAGLIMGLIDWLVAARWGGQGAGTLAAILPTVTFVASVVSPIPALVALADGGVTPIHKPLRTALAIATGLVLAAPSYVSLVHAVAAGLPLKWFIGAFMLVQLVLAAWLCLRDTRALLWPAAGTATALLMFAVCNSVGLFVRAGKSLHDPIVFGTAGLSLAALFFGSALVRWMRSCQGDVPGLLVAASATVSGMLLTAVACVIPPDLYLTARWGALLASYSLLSLGLSRWARKVPLRIVVSGSVVAATAGIGLDRALPTTSNIVWSSTHSTTVMRLISAETGLFSGRDRALLAELLVRPEAAMGASLANSDAAKTPPELPSRAQIDDVVLVTIDALRFDHTGYSGLAPKGITPNLDRLAGQSIRFINAYSQAPGTGLSMSSLLWSRFPAAIDYRRILGTRERIFSVEDFPPDATLFFTAVDPMDEPTKNLQEQLSKSQVLTATVSDGFMGNLRRDSGLVRGFAEVIVPGTIDSSLEDDWTADHALAWIHIHATERFFLWVHLFSPHLDYRTHADGSGFVGYQSEVHFADTQLGRILSGIDDVGLATKTVVIVCADHGESLGEGGRYAHTPEVYEELVHVPLVVRWPGAQEHTVKATAPLISLAPTVLRAFKVDVPSSMTGRDLIPYLRNPPETADSPAFLYAWTQDLGSARRHNIRAGVVDGRMKAVLDAATGAIACYDLAADPSESRNVLGGKSSACLRPASLLAGWFHEVGPKLR